MELVFTFIGTIVGAGFASGQEIRKYFVDFSGYGFIGIVFASFLFMIIGEKIMLMGYKRKADSYDDILGYGFKCKFRIVVDYCLCFFLIATASTMFSGTGAFLYQSFGLNAEIGSLIMAIITFFIVILGINGIMKISTIIVPILILLTCVISVISFFNIDIGSLTLINEVKYKDTISALISALIYGAYNITMALSILPALGGKAKSERDIRIISIFSGLIIGAFGSIIYFALLANYDKIHSAEIPIAVLAGETYGFLYGASFVIAVLTTAVGCLYGVYTRFDKNILGFLCICIGAYIISLFGFSVLVARLYYIMGILGIIIISMLLMGYKRSKDNYIMRKNNIKKEGI